MADEAAGVGPARLDTSLSTEAAACEARRRTATVAADIPTLEGLLDEGLRYIHSNGSVDTRESHLAALAEGRVRYRSMEVLEEERRAYGRTALLTGSMRMQALVGDVVRSVSVRFTVVWTAEQGDWRCVSWHSSPLVGAS